MAVANIFTGAVVAEILFLYILSNGSVLARDHLHVAHFASPSGRTDTVILVLMLHARCLVLARIVRTPVHVLVAPCARVSVWTVACVILHVIMAGSAVQTGQAIALVDAILTIGTGIARLADARVVVDTVDAFATVHAATVSAVLVIGLAIDAGEAELALTGIRVNVFFANSTILARLR